jgi:hypothetical protein
MSYVNRVVALASGIAMIPVFGYAAEFILIRTSNPGLDLAILPVQIALFTLAWSWITLRWLARPPRVTVWWCLGGLLVGVLCMEVVSAVQDYQRCVDWHFSYETRYLNYQKLARANPNSGIAHYYPPPACGSILANLQQGLAYLWSMSAAEILSFISGLAAAAAIVLKSERITARAVPA